MKTDTDEEPERDVGLPGHSRGTKRKASSKGKKPPKKRRKTRKTRRRTKNVNKSQLSDGVLSSSGKIGKIKRKKRKSKKKKRKRKVSRLALKHYHLFEMHFVCKFVQIY